MASHQNSDKQYYLITNVRSTHSSSTSSSSTSERETEIELHAQSWQLPFEVDDKDLTFDGKPLNMLYEENKYRAEHRVGESREHRGRSRSKK